MDRDIVRAAVPNDSHSGLRLLAALDGVVTEHAEAENSASNAVDVWPRRVRHLASLGLLIDDSDAVLADLQALADDGGAFTVTSFRRTMADGDEVYTALVTHRPPRMRASFAHRLPS